MQQTTITATEAVARILTTVADRLAEHATITHPFFGTTEAACMTQGWLDTALWRAQGALDRGVSMKVRTLAWPAVREALPPVTGTVAEYATQLRARSITPA